MSAQKVTSITESAQLQSSAQLGGLVWGSELGTAEEEDFSWLWQGYLARGRLRNSEAIKFLDSLTLGN
jgi:hypothetical protein